MAMLASETWTGANGAAWPTQWTAGLMSTGATATIQSNSGQVTAPTGYKTARQFLNGMTPVGGTKVVTVDVTLSAITEHYIDVANHCMVDTSSYYINGYYVQLSPSAGTWQLTANRSDNNYQSATAVTRAYVAGHTYRVQSQVVYTSSTNIVASAKVWDLTAGEAEPSSYTSTLTDTSGRQPATGIVGLDTQSGNSTNPAVTFDNLTVTDGASAPTYTGSLISSGSGTSTMTGKPAITAPIVSNGSGQTVIKGAPGITSTTTNSGNGSGTLAGSPNITSPILSGSSSTSTLIGSPNITSPLTATGSGGSSLIGAPDVTDAILTSGSGTSVLVGRPDLVGPLATSGEGTSFLVAEGENTGAFVTSGTGTSFLAGHADIVAPVTASGGGDAALHGTAAVMAALMKSGLGTSVLIGHAAVSQPAHTYTASLDTGWTASLVESTRTAALASNGWEASIHA